MLHGLTSATSLQTDLLGTVNLAAVSRSRARMQALDTLTSKYGHQALRPAAEILSSQWQPRSQLLSPRYTSAWSELPEASIS